MADTSKYDVRNTAKGIRGLHGVDGYAELAPGEVREGFEMTAAEHKSATRTGYFAFGKAATADDEGTSGDDLDTTVDKLRDIATAEGVELGTATKKADIQEAIRAARLAKSQPPADDLDNMNDSDLRATVQAITGEQPAADADRETLLKLARGQE